MHLRDRYIHRERERVRGCYGIDNAEKDSKICNNSDKLNPSLLSIMLLEFIK